MGHDSIPMDGNHSLAPTQSFLRRNILQTVIYCTLDLRESPKLSSREARIEESFIRRPTDIFPEPSNLSLCLNGHVRIGVGTGKRNRCLRQIKSTLSICNLLSGFVGICYLIY